MKKAGWKKKIKKACEEAGTYQPFFDEIIDTLSQIMETRDDTHEQYMSTGGHPTVIHTNKAKEKNIAKNPILVLEMELNTQALAYWRDLGLTPSGLRKISAESLVKVETSNSLEKILESLTDG